MFKTTAPGFFLLISSIALYLFKLVSRLMDRDIQMFSLKEIFGIEWISSIPLAVARQIMVTISTQQLSLLFFILGLSFIFIGVFQKNRY